MLFFGARGREPPPPLETRAWFHSIRSRFDSGSIRFDSAGEAARGPHKSRMGFDESLLAQLARHQGTNRSLRFARAPNGYHHAGKWCLCINKLIAAVLKGHSITSVRFTTLPD